MNILLLIVHLLPYIPMYAPTYATVPAAVAGTGTLLVTSCPIGSTVVIEPGQLRGTVDQDGVAEIKAPAQADGADPYQLYANGLHAEMNGTLSAHESLSGVCP
jgi:hypothetical protein